MPTLVACLWRCVEATQLGRVPTHFGPATRLRRPKSPWNQGALATSQVEMCPRTANSGLRKRRGFTQRSLAALLDVAPNTVNQLETSGRGRVETLDRMLAVHADVFLLRGRLTFG